MRKLAALVEAERRGILAGKPLQMLQEARRRGLVSEPKDPVAQAIKDSTAVNSGLVQAVMDAIKAQRPPVVNVLEREHESPPAPRINVQVPEATADHLVGLRFRVVRDRNGYMEYMQIERGDD